MKKQSTQENENRQDGWAGTFCEFILAIARAIGLFANLRQTNQDLCQGPAWFWVNFAKVYYLVNAVLSLLTLICCRPKFLNERTTAKVIGALIFLTVKVAVGLAGIALAIGTIISFAKINECNDLKVIVTILFIVLMIRCVVIGLASCFCIASVCMASKGDQKDIISRLKTHWIAKRLLSPPSYTKILRKPTKKTEEKSQKESDPSQETLKSRTPDP